MNINKHFKLVGRIIFIFLFVSIQTVAQIDPKARERKEKIDLHAGEKAESTLDSSLDEVEEGVVGLFSKKKSKEIDVKNSEKINSNKTNETDDGESSDITPKEKSNPQAVQSIKSYTKFDFIPGESIFFYDDFSQENIGDFPVSWNTSSKGEVVTIDNQPGKWFKLGMDGVFVPEFKGKLPENFTLEFDVVFDIIDPAWAGFMALDFFNGNKNPVENDPDIGETGFKLRCSSDDISYSSWGAFESSGSVQSSFIQEHDKQKFRVSIWIQKTRARLYLNEQKIIDLPKFIPVGIIFDRFRFEEIGVSAESNQLYISNFRIAVGAPDLRSKLITEGKLVTRGITFDSGSDKIKPESFGVLKEIASILKDNSGVKVKIIGHTDSDGDDKMNLDLSKKRALAVKNSLNVDFGIDSGRMEADGKGEGQPVMPNTSSEGKANNRRVEFIKL